MARLNKYDRMHQGNMNKYLRLIDEIYKKAAGEAARIGVSLTRPDPDKIFSFDDYPMTGKRIDALLREYGERLSAVIVNGVKSEWTLSNNKNNELCHQVFGDLVGKLSKAQYRRYFNNNEDALNAFLQRKESGLNLSDRVWNYTHQFKYEIELGLDVGIRQGMSADELSRQLRDFLKYPDKLFRRVRDEHGQLQLSKAAAEFHPGSGVYRSSYKNARRLAVTETNMAYRSADYERWQQMDFVVGIHIEPSNTNHPIVDICDELAGDYPKDFKFTGWHPHCRCHVLTILKTMDEMAEDAERIMRGEDPSEHSVNSVDSIPDGFAQWIQQNNSPLMSGTKPVQTGHIPLEMKEFAGRLSGKRLDKLASLAIQGKAPYFVTDNIEWFPTISKVKFGNGFVEIHSDVNRRDNDFKKLWGIARVKANQGNTCTLTPKLSRRSNFEYDEIYGGLKGTKYYGKCPDLKVETKGGKTLWYEHEGFVSDNPKRAFSNMMNHGLKQSSRIIIDRPNLTERFMRNSIIKRVKEGAIIDEVWIREVDGRLTKLY